MKILKFFNAEKNTSHSQALQNCTTLDALVQQQESISTSVSVSSLPFLTAVPIVLPLRERNHSNAHTDPDLVVVSTPSQYLRRVHDADTFLSLGIRHSPLRKNKKGISSYQNFITCGERENINGNDWD